MLLLKLEKLFLSQFFQSATIHPDSLTKVIISYTQYPPEVMKRGLWSSILCTSSRGSKVRISTYLGRTAMMYGGWCSINETSEKYRLIVLKYALKQAMT